MLYFSFGVHVVQYAEYFEYPGSDRILATFVVGSNGIVILYSSRSMVMFLSSVMDVALHPVLSRWIADQCYGLNNRVFPNGAYIDRGNCIVCVPP